MNQTGKEDALIRRAWEFVLERLFEEGRVYVSDVGVFSVRKRKARRIVDRQTGESLLLPESRTIHFRPAKSSVESVKSVPVDVIESWPDAVKRRGGF